MSNRIAEVGLQQSLLDDLLILQNSNGFETGVNITGEKFRLLQQHEMVLFGIIQEALNNIVKHAKAKNISLQLVYTPQLFTLTVQDDGKGFDAAALQNKTGTGLKTMQNRAKLIGATCTLQSSPDNGTSITIELPTLNFKP